MASRRDETGNPPSGRLPREIVGRMEMSEAPSGTTGFRGPRSHVEMAVLVNSSDGFRDCWFPFFHLLEKYWPDCRFPIYLNIEQACYENPTLAVRCLNHPPTRPGQKVPWSNRLLASLDAIPEPYVLYLQEDYFLDAPVDHRRLEECLALVSTAGLGCVHLTPYGSHGGQRVAELPYLVDVPRVSHYRLSTQAAIWDKEALRSYVRPDETVWETEILGTMRSWSRPTPVRSVDAALLDGGAIMSYTGTGIIRGKWHPEMQLLFARHGLEVDFDQRGFYTFPSRWQTRSRIMAALLRRPLRPLAALCGL